MRFAGRSRAGCGRWTSPSLRTRSTASTPTCYWCVIWRAARSWHRFRARTRRRETVREVLEALIAQHGAPLVIKWDNDSAFRELELEMVLRW